ncbi:MAG: agglutinin biogenesis protein MshI [Betaproteobacteria bacterium]|nr:MAG: agglutinin biogenesis protein MshI [Betaproteobacteria bacterium]
MAIEPEAIKFAHVQHAGDRPHATYWGSVSSDASDPASSLQSAANEHGFGRVTCTTLLEPADYQILMVEPPKVPADELKAAIRWKIKDLIEYHIDDATVDVFEVRGEGEAKGTAKAMYAVATPNEVVQKRIALFEEASVPLKVIDIPEMAQRNIAGLFESPDKATAMLAFSSWGGLLTISIHGELLLTRRLEVTSTQLGQREHGDHYRERGVGVGNLLLAPLPQDPELEQFLAGKLYVPVVGAALPEVMDFAGGTEPTAQEQWEYFHLFGAALRVEGKAL